MTIPDRPPLPPERNENQPGQERKEGQADPSTGERKDDISIMPFPGGDGRWMPIMVRTDENGNYKAQAFSGPVMVIAGAPGYSEEQIKLELRKDSRTEQDFRLARQPKVFQLTVVWGYIGENNPKGTFVPWDGSISVDNGAAVKLADLIEFEHGGEYRNGGDDSPLPQQERSTVSWRSSTTVARDGVVVDIIAFPGKEPVTVTIKAGSWSLTIALHRLVGMRELFKADDEGRQVAVCCFPLECFEPPMPPQPPLPPDVRSDGTEPPVREPPKEEPAPK